MRKKKNLKSNFLSYLIVFGLYAFQNFDDTKRSLSFIFVGLVLFLPGSYSFFIILNVLYEVEGYSMEDIASYDED